MGYQVAWIVMLLAFAVLEGLTAGLVSIWFCIGCIAALVATMCGGSIAVQVTLFVVVSLISMALIRPVARKYMHTKQEKTNADRIIGMEGVVTEPIDNLQATGQIKVQGVYWTARTEENVIVPEGARVRVLRIEGVKTIVSQIEKG